MLIGYKIIPDNDKNPQLLIEELKNYGCELIFTDENVSSKRHRPGLKQLKNKLCQEDSLIIRQLDCLANSMKDLFEWMDYLKKKGIVLISLQDSIDTSAPSGEVIFNIFDVLQKFERNLTLKRTYPGLLAARASGRVGGRPPVISPERRKQIIELYNQKQMSKVKICRLMKISKPTLYKIIKNSSSSE